VRRIRRRKSVTSRRGPDQHPGGPGKSDD